MKGAWEILGMQDGVRGLFGKHYIPVFNGAFCHRHGMAVAHCHVNLTLVAVAHPFVITCVIIGRRAYEVVQHDRRAARTTLGYDDRWLLY